ncbi:hypothetical protein K503DRAFT_795455 [Rhizopogon vinicolor AM-OR11-026]|uniref:Uncharacterized protein n=1 Tax=Rhizopogon vinicolor AM-OR11-026 TaxID=1314800 RepID=A0A1B7NHH2_9AGAM|nr:hypothetical protein K503DRAFT_795455 [Rhizopogon vinicolor AM-OR11-026]
MADTYQMPQVPGLIINFQPAEPTVSLCSSPLITAPSPHIPFSRSHHRPSSRQHHHSSRQHRHSSPRLRSLTPCQDLRWLLTWSVGTSFF